MWIHEYCKTEKNLHFPVRICIGLEYMVQNEGIITFQEKRSNIFGIMIIWATPNVVDVYISGIYAREDDEGFEFKTDPYRAEARICASEGEWMKNIIKSKINALYTTCMGFVISSSLRFCFRYQ